MHTLSNMGWFHYAVAEGKLDDLNEEPASSLSDLADKTTKTAAPTACPLPVDADVQDLTVPPGEPIYHLCQMKRFYQAVKTQQAYFPPTYLKDGRFTRASYDKPALLEAANLYYKDRDQDFLCLELDPARLLQLGIPVTAQIAPEKSKDRTVKCLQIFGGISTGDKDGVVLNIFKVQRGTDGSFLQMVDIDCGCGPAEAEKAEETATPNPKAVASGKPKKKGLFNRRFR